MRKFFVHGGFNHTISLDHEGFVWSWGDNSEKQLGRKCGYGTHVPQKVEGLSMISQISCGGNFSAAIDFDGNLWTFGQVEGMKRKVEQFSSPLKFASVFCGPTHAVFITTEGDLWGCGKMNIGESLGIDTPSRGIVPLKMKNVVSAACGGNVTLVLCGDGKIFAAGNNYNGKKIPGTRFSRICEDLENIIFVGAGWEHSLFLREDGAVFGIGKNSSGELGLTGGSYLRATQLELPPIVMVNCALNHSVFLDTENNIWTCGFTGGGRLGTPTKGGKSPTIAITDCVGMSYGGNTTFVQTAEQQFMVFGRNDFGQLGYDPSFYKKFETPTSFPFPEVIGMNVLNRSKSARK